MLKNKSFFWSPLWLGLIAVFSLANTYPENPRNDVPNIKILITQLSQLQKTSITIQQKVVQQQTQQVIACRVVKHKYWWLDVDNLSRFIFPNMLIRAP